MNHLILHANKIRFGYGDLGLVLIHLKNAGYANGFTGDFGPIKCDLVVADNDGVFLVWICTAHE